MINGGLREAAHDELRLALGDEHPVVRIRAAEMIALQHDLHDVGLLMDLQQLPEVQADPREHAALAAAIETLSGRSAPNEASEAAAESHRL